MDYPKTSKRLSLGAAQIKNHYDAIVIGSGYGASIAASRLARGGKKVCILERGKEFLPGEFPRKTSEALPEMQVNAKEKHIGSKTGLFDFHVNKDISVYVGCGLGGGSLVNANVSLPPEERVMLSKYWPEAFRNDMGPFKRGMERAWHMLQPNPYPEGEEGYGKLPKAEAMKLCAEGLSKGAFKYLDLNVHFKNAKNNAGVEQQKCVLCGDCMVGCNYGAKNMTMVNYLPDARNHGAEIFTMIGVQYVSRRADGKWMVYYKIQNADSEKFEAPELFVTADMVVIGAGSLGSTEILLRSKEKGLGVSSKLGSRFTGNGDVIGFGYNNDVRINAVGFGKHDVGDIDPVGPCITSVIDLRNQEVLEDGMVMEDSTVPGVLADALPAAFLPLSQLIGFDTDEGLVDMIKEKAREITSLVRGPYHGAIHHTQAFLVMSHDSGNGQMKLENNRLSIDWPGVGKEPIFEKVNKNIKTAAETIGGTYMPNPGWTKLLNYDLVTVHPLGGCVMADDASKGVVNHKGQVFSSDSGTAVYDGLYVCDGAVIPMPLGVNPLITISAVAERTCELMAADHGFTINYDYKDFNMDDAVVKKPGVQFTEAMKGFWDMHEKNDFEKGLASGKQSGSLIDFTLSVISDDVDKLVTVKEHPARIAGIFKIPVLSSRPLTASNGAFNLFEDMEGVAKTKLMKYSMNLHSEEGKTYFFYGYKSVHHDKGFDTWTDTSTLYITIHDGLDDKAPVLGKGIMVIKTKDFITQMTTMKPLNTTSKMEDLEVMTKFGKYFAGSIFDIYIKGKM